MCEFQRPCESWKAFRLRAGKAIPICGHPSPGTAVHIAWDLQGGVILGDRLELAEALSHIIENGLEAMPAGGQLTLHSRTRVREVEIVVVDTRRGMSDEIVGRVFDPFFTTKPPGGEEVWE